MKGHPAIAYLVAEQMLDVSRGEGRSDQIAKSASKTRSVRFGPYRLTITKEVPGVAHTV